MRLSKNVHNKNFYRNIFVSAALIAAAISAAPFAHADSIDDIRQKITENNKKIEAIQKEIDQYSTLLDSTSKQAQTLKKALADLTYTQKKLEANLALTTTKIKTTNLTLDELASDIKDTEAKIGKTTTEITESIQEMSIAESDSPIENFLRDRSISETWDHVNALHTLAGRIKLNLEDLKELNLDLGKKRDAAEGEKTKLVNYQKNLSDQKKVVVSNQEEKNQLLEETKSTEANYKKLLASRIKEQDVFEKELFEYESKLKIAIDPTAIPTARTGILAWPFNDSYIDKCPTFVRVLGNKACVTQYFGYTAAAAKLYKTTAKHNGIDFKAQIGTPIQAVLSGIVSDVEAYKAKSGCQYGKYVLIKHPNGLSTIYGHLSVVSVSTGDTVITGDTIGYSGATGYATGPHLHFGVYVTQGIRLVDASSLGSTRCAGIKTVAAPPTAYLDPMAYLPSL